MSKKDAVIILTVFLIAFFIANASALAVLGNKSSEIEKSYAPNDKLRGWINLSLRNESSNSQFYSNLDINNKIWLIDFLDSNFMIEGVDYTCNPFGCDMGYAFSGSPESSKSDSMSYLDEKLIAFKLTGNLSGIGSLSFDISASNENSCINPLEIDILDDGLIDWTSSEVTDDFSCMYDGGMGCFNTNESLTEVDISATTPYCEKIKLPASSKFMLGAWVKNKSAWSSGLLKMSLYNTENTFIKSCPISEPPSSNGLVNCSIDYKNYELQDYYVCLKANSAVSPAYATKMESKNSCGFFANPGQQTAYNDYYIFAKAAKFASIGNFTFDQAEFARQGNTGRLDEELSAYIQSRYDNNCANGCAIPIVLRAFGNVNLKVSNAVLTYSTTDASFSEARIYDATREPAKINSGFITLDLGKANVSLPSGYGNKSLILYIGNTPILTQSINIARVPLIKGISPTNVPAAASVKLIADVSSPNKSIVSYIWNFGDESLEETTTRNFVNHAYPDLGFYILKLTAIDNEGLSASKEFEIIAGNPKDAANVTLKKYRGRIANLTSIISSYPEWYKKIVENETGITESDEQLKELEKQFAIAGTEEEYTRIMSSLSGMQLPYDLRKSASGTIPITIDKENIDLARLEELGAGSYDDEKSEAYKNAIEQWAGANLNLEAEIFTISAYYDKGVLPILNYFKLNIEPLSIDEIENYLIINEAAIVNTGEVKEFDNGVGVIFDSLESRSVEFIVSGEIVPTEISLYLSPEFKNLNLAEAGIYCRINGKCERETGENWRNCREDCKPIARTIIYLLILIFISFIVYILLEEWYKRKYENYLFKNRNDLFNLVNFINNALNKNMEKGEIEKRLKSFGWSSEQASYAFKKVKGKRTGMPIEFTFPPWKVNKGVSEQAKPGNVAVKK